MATQNPKVVGGLLNTLNALVEANGDAQEIARRREQLTRVLAVVKVEEPVDYEILKMHGFLKNVFPE